VLLAALRDLQWRRRRVAITVLGTGLVFAMTLMLSGLSASFEAETARFVGQFHADSFVFSTQAAGPFTGSLPVNADTAAAISAMPGVVHASPIILVQAPISHESVPMINLIGVDRGGVGLPRPATGDSLSDPGQVVTSTKLGKHPGDTVELGGRSFTVVGTIDSTVLGGIPAVYMSIGDVQAVALGGAPLATAFATTGKATHLPDGFSQDSPSQAVANLVRPLRDAHGAISFLAVLLWIVAGCVLGSVMYLSAMERTRDFAVFKATGVSNRSLLAGLALQAVIIALVAALIGAVIGAALAPFFPLNVEITRSSLIALPFIAVAVGLLASLVGMRRVTSIDPAAAFGGP